MSHADYVLFTKLGSGGSASTYAARHLPTRELRLVKLFEPQFGGGSVLAEVRTLQSVAHVPGAVRLHDWSERRVYAPGSPFDGRYFIAMELLSNSGLDFYRIAPAAPAGLPEPVLRAYARSIAQTLRAAHAAGVAHLDIKLENVCLDASFAPRVVDWGCSVANIDANRTRLSRAPASALSAPESIYQLYGGFQGAKADVWSLGVLLFALALKAQPYDAAGDYWFGLLNYPDRSHYWAAFARHTPASAGLSAELRAVLGELLTVNAARRITLEGFLAHPWFAAGPTATDAEVAASMGALRRELKGSLPAGPEWTVLEDLHIPGGPVATVAAVAAATAVAETAPEATMADAATAVEPAQGGATACGDVATEEKKEAALSIVVIVDVADEEEPTSSCAADTTAPAPSNSTTTKEPSIDENATNEGAAAHLGGGASAASVLAAAAAAAVAALVSPNSSSLTIAEAVEVEAAPAIEVAHDPNLASAQQQKQQQQQLDESQMSIAEAPAALLAAESARGDAPALSADNSARAAEPPSSTIAESLSDSDISIVDDSLLGRRPKPPVVLEAVYSPDDEEENIASC